MVTPFIPVQGIPGLETLAHPAISPTMIGLCDITKINELIQGRSGIMPATKKGKLHVKVCTVNRTEWVHTLVPMKFFPKAGANLFSLMCKLSQRNKISSNHPNNIVVNAMWDNIILDHQIKTHNGWVAKDNFLHETNNKRAASATATPQKNINDLHIEAEHPSKTITHAIAEALGIQLTGTFKPWEDCALGMAKQCVAGKKAVPCFKILGEDFSLI